MSDDIPPSQEPLPLQARDLTAARLAPLYDQVKRQISEHILAGTWPAGMVLPGETALAQEFGVAVGTVRRAMADLTAEGLLTRRRKTGTIVTGRAPHHSLRFFFHYFRLHDRNGQLLRSQTDVLERRERPATEIERSDLALDGSARVLELVRLRRINGRAVMHETLVLPQSRVPDFPPKDEMPPLLYMYLLERYGIRISAVREQISADLATPSDAERLNLGDCQAVLVIEEVAFDQAGLPMIRAVHRAVTDEFRYVNEVR